MAIHMTKMSLLREAISEDIAFIVYDMDVKSNYGDVLSGLRKATHDRKTGIFKLTCLTSVYYEVVKTSFISYDDECDKCMWSNIRKNKLVLDVVRDIPHLVRISNSSAEFRMKVIELYGRSGFLCGVALEYMTTACHMLLPALLEMEDDE
jgi:hypothetical protein